MQCINCEFENMPSISVCVRCGSALQLSDLCAEPPRASRMHTATRIRRLGHALQNRCGQLRGCGRWFSPRILVPLAAPDLLWSVIPGLGHIKTGSRRLGYGILAVWLLFVLLAILGLGTSWQDLLYSMIVAVHAFAIVSVFAARLSYEHLVVRGLFGLLAFGGLYLFVYQPLRDLGARVYTLLPVPPLRSNEFLHAGDVVLLQGPWTRPDSFQRGDLVTYRIGARRGQGVYIRSGLGLDRILAISGDHAQVTAGQVLINGAPALPGQGPLAALPPEADFEWNIRPGEYLIFPTGLRLTSVQQSEAHRLVREACVVQEDSVLGRMVLRLRPLRRFGVIR